MNIRLSHKWWISIGITALVLIVVGVVSVALAQEPDGGLTVSPEALYSQTWAFTYQGRLLDGRALANGDYDFAANVYSHPTTASLVATCIDVGPGLNNYHVEDGLFTFYLRCDDGNSNVFTGGDRWLEVQVAPHGTGITTTLDRQPIAPVPYAFSLFPGAVISGTPTAWDGWVLRADMVGAYPVGAAVAGTTATGSAVRGESPGGNGVYGYTDDGYAVYGWDSGSTQAKGYGGYFYSANGVGVYGYSGAPRTVTNNNAPGVYGRSTWGAGVYGYSLNGPGGRFASYTDSIIEAYQDSDGNGAVNYRRFRVDPDGEVYADGGYHCGKVAGCWSTNDPADFAEVLPTTDDPEPGDVLVIDQDGRLTPSTAPYQTNVVGVYSTNPMVIGNGENLDQEGYAPLAVVGLVPVKASAENGPILPGDLLVASSTPGHAMKAGPNPPIGSVVGKALEPLTEGTGVIQMLVMLQ